MKTDFKFSSLLGSVYCQGNVLFSPDGQILYSPVSNRVTAFDLVNNRSWTFPFAHRKNVARIGLSPRGNLLVTVDEDGHAILTNVERRVSIYHFSFRSPVTALAFSPSGRHFAVGIGRRIEVWHVPSTPDASATGELEFAPFVRHHSHAGHYDDVTHLEWSSDSRFFLSAAKDLTARIWSLNPEAGFRPTVLAGHKQAVVGAWFSENQETIYTTSRDGAVFEWRYAAPPREGGQDDGDSDDSDSDADMGEDAIRWRIVRRHYFMQGSSTVRCAVFHPESSLLVAGFSDGVFGLYELTDAMSQIHKLSVSNDIDTVSINRSGEWVAFASAKTRSLLVWEWQSESYVLKQSSHFDAINALVYAPDGKRIITTADDGKIKIWDAESGFTIATFTEHQSGVTACEFAKRGNVLFTASLDGSVRAWDLVRYRCFRTFTAPTRLSFTSMAVDPSGEVVCAGSIDSFDIHVWSVQTGQLLDRLSGHEGPVSSLAFAPDGSTLASGSWDKTARLWNIFSRTATSEPLQHQADVLAVAVRPDSKQLAVSTLDGQLSFWDIQEAEQVAGVDGRRDVSGGRKASDRRTAANMSGNKAFNTVQYSRDGSCVLAGGRSKYICLYSVHTMVLLKKWTVSVNLSLSGTQEFLNSKLLTEGGPTDMLDDQGELSDPDARRDLSLPGSKRGDPSSRRKQAEVRVSGVAFSPAGTAFCAASTEGLLVYSTDAAVQFDPFDLTIEVTPAATLAVLEQERDYVKALVMAFRLNDMGLVGRVFQAVPPADISLVVAQVPTVYLGRLLKYVAAQTEESPHVEFCLLWVRGIVDKHGAWLAANRGKLDVELRLVSRAVARMRDDIRRLADDNVYTVAYLVSQAGKGGAKTRSGTMAAAIDVLMPVAADVDMDSGEAAAAAGDDSEGEWMGFE